MSNDSQKKSKNVIISAVKMGLATFSSRILGLIREQVTAYAFGASGMTDAFFVAFRIPNLLRDLFAEGAFSSAFVPVFTEVKQKYGDIEARRLFWSMAVLLGLITLFLTAVIFIFAAELIRIFAPDFVNDPVKFEVTVVLIRIMSPFLFLISLAALFMGALNALKVFFMPAMAPACFNIVMIISILFLPQVLSPYGIHPIISMGIGGLIGGLVQLLVQIPQLFLKNYGFVGPIKLISSHSKKILNRIGIGTIAIAANQINVLVSTMLATSAGVGAVSWLTYAFRLFQFPIGILSVSISGSNLVHFSEAWKSGDIKSAKEILQTSYFLSFITIIPAAALLFAMSQETVNLIFERGLFGINDTLMTTLALKCYILGLPFYGLYKIFAPVFFALEKPKIPVICSVFSIFLNIIFCISFVPYYGFKILALGTSITMILNVSIQSLFLKKLVELPIAFFMNLRILKMLFSGCITLLITHQLIKNYYPTIESSFFIKLPAFILIGLLGAVTYLLLMLLFGERQILSKILKNK